MPNAEGLMELREKIDRAFDFRGNVHVDLENGGSEEGFLFNRDHATRQEYSGGFIEIFRKGDGERIRLGIDQVVDVRLTGKDYFKPFVSEEG